MDTSETYTRRGVLRAGAGAVAAGAVITAGSTGASAQAYDGYLDDVGNFNNETADARTFDPVPIDVGYVGNGLMFGPPAAVLIEPGTTVRWTWTGEGGAHNVVHDVDEAARVFDSGDPVVEEGHTYEHTFEEEGVYPYVCTPHRAQEMKGVIVVGEDLVETDLVDADFEAVGAGLTPIWGGAAVFGFVSFLGLAAYRELAESESN